MDNFLDELKNIASESPESSALDLMLITDKLIRIFPNQHKFTQLKSKLTIYLLNIYTMSYNNGTSSSTKDISEAIVNEIEIVNETVEFKIFIQEFVKKNDYKSLMTDIVEYEIAESKIEELYRKIKVANQKILNSSLILNKIVAEDDTNEYKDLIDFYQSIEKEEILEKISDKIFGKVKSSFVTELTLNLNRIINYLSHGDLEFTTRPIDNLFDKFKISRGLELFCKYSQHKISQKSNDKLEEIINHFIRIIL